MAAIGVGTTLALLDAIIKERWMKDDVAQQILWNSQFYSLCSGRSSSMNQYFDRTCMKLKFPIALAATGGVGREGTAGALPSFATDAQEKTFTLGMPYWWLRWGYHFAFLSSAESRVVGRKMVRDFANNRKRLEDMLSRSFLGAGSGKLTAVTGAATVSVSPAGYKVPVKDVSVGVIGTYLQLLNASDATVANDLQVVGKSVRYGAGNLIVTSATNLATSSLLNTFSIAAQNTSLQSDYCHGLEEIVSGSNTYPTSGEGGLDRTNDAYTDWRSQVIDMTSANWNGKTPLEAAVVLISRLDKGARSIVRIDRQTHKRARKHVKMIYGDQDVIDAMIVDAQGKHTVVNAGLHDMMGEFPTLKGIPLIGDRLVRGRLYFLSFDSWHHMHFGPLWQPGNVAMDGYQSRHFRGDTGTANHECSAMLACQLHCDQPGEQGVVTGLDGTVFDPDFGQA